MRKLIINTTNGWLKFLVKIGWLTNYVILEKPFQAKLHKYVNKTDTLILFYKEI